jgi:hypothetical protein
LSTIKATTLSNLAGSKTVPTDTVVDGSAKAWVNFNGTGTVAIRRAFNVSSITDNGTGDYTVNFTSAMSDANYAISGSCAESGAGGRWLMVSAAAAQTTSTFRMTTFNNSNAAADLQFVQASVFS